MVWIVEIQSLKQFFNTLVSHFKNVHMLFYRKVDTYVRNSVLDSSLTSFPAVYLEP